MIEDTVSCPAGIRIQRTPLRKERLAFFSAILAGGLAQACLQEHIVDFDEAPQEEESDLDSVCSEIYEDSLSVPWDGDDISQIRDGLSNYYCGAETNTGWEGCYGDLNPVVPPQATEECGEAVAPLLRCIYLDDEDPVCTQYRPPAACFGHEFDRYERIFPACDALCDADTEVEDQGDFAMRRAVSDCADGHQYAYNCRAPNDTCTSHCTCYVDGAITRETNLVTIEKSFFESLWAACQFPEELWDPELEPLESSKEHWCWDDGVHPDDK